MSGEVDNNANRKPSIWVWLAAICALMSGMAMGSLLGWSSPAMPKMGESDSTPHLSDKNDEDKEIMSWIGSSLNLGALVGALLGSWVLNWLGFKKTLIGTGAPLILGWVLIGVAKVTWLMIMGRVFAGFAIGMCCGVTPNYCLQISTPNIRGLLGAGFQVFIVIGVLYMDVFGLCLGWRALCVAGVVPAVIMTVGMFFMPESPSWLINKYGNNAQAVDSLRRLRQNDSDIDQELKELEDRAKEAKNGSGFSMSQCSRADFYKPFIIGNALMFFQQFSGINAVIFYSSSIFKDSGSSMDPMVSTCMVTAAMVAATLVGSLIIDRLGRKILLIVSGIGHVISLGLMGYYYYHKTHTSESSNDSSTVGSVSTTVMATIASTTTEPKADSLGWLPVLCLILFVVAFSVGYGPIPWMIVGEITPAFAIGLVSPIATFVNWFSVFVITKEFPAIQEAITKYGAFWLFGGISAASIVFTFLFVPESKGKSIEDMQKIFLGTGYVDQEKDRYNINKDVSKV